MKKIIFVFALMCALGVTRAQDSIPRPHPQRALRVLVTSFGSYWKFYPNHSQLLMAYVQETYSKKNVKISFQVLQNSSRYCQEWSNAMDMNKYDLIIHTGVAETIEIFQLEKYARSASSAQTKGLVICSKNSVYENGPESYATDIDLDALVQKTPYRECMMVSEDAGDYLCNFIYYLTCNKITSHSISADALFVHIPPFEKISMGEQYCIFENLLDLLVEYEYSKKSSMR